MGKLPYEFGILRTDRSEAATRHNDLLLGENTLGLEITRHDLAGRCGLGNIDPQHGPDGESSAVERALTWSLPPEGTVVVTVRLDKDAVMAAALLLIRKMGDDKLIDREFISWVGALDRMPFRHAREKYPELAAMFSDRAVTDALNVIAKHGDATLTKRVVDTARILIGDMPIAEVREIASVRLNRQMETFRPVQVIGNVAFFVEPGKYDQAREYGNRNFLVAVVFDSQRKTNSGGLQQRWTIVRQALPNKVFDRVGCEQVLNETEAELRGLTLEELRGEGLTWGGPPHIISSPQGEGNESRIPEQQILEIVYDHLESGVVS